jgi:hypothetical protein
MNLAIQLLLSIILYISLIIAVRLMDNALGDLQPSYVFVTLLISDLAATDSGHGTPIVIGIVPIVF